MEQRVAAVADHGANAGLGCHDRRPCTHDLLGNGTGVIGRVAHGLAGFLERNLEGPEVQFAHGLLVSPRADELGAASVGLVERKVLEVAVHTLVARAGNHALRQLARKHGVFRVVLKDAAREERAMQVEARRVPARDSVRQTLGADSLAHLVEKVLAPRSRSQGLVPVGAALCHVIAVVGTLDLEAVGAIHVDGRRKTNGVDGCGHIRVPREVPHDARLVRVPVNLVEKRVPPGIVVRGAAQVGGHETVLGAGRGLVRGVDQASLDVAEACVRRGVERHEEVVALGELVVD